MKKGIIILLILSILLIPTPHHAETIVNWEVTDSLESFRYQRYAMTYFESNGNLMVSAGVGNIFYNSSLDRVSVYENKVYYNFNSTLSFYWGANLGGDNLYGFHNPITNDTYVVDQNFGVWRYNNTYFLNDTYAEIAGEFSVWYNHTDLFDFDFYKPATRNDYSMVYDFVNGKMILFGGGTNPIYYGDTWVFDLDTNNWSQLTPAIHPDPRSGHTMVYNLDDGMIYLFGGDNNVDNGYFNDLWQYDVNLNLWTEIDMENPISGRYKPTMLYDTYNKKILVHGGYRHNEAGSIIFQSDLWALDLDSLIWTFLTTSSGPEISDTHWIMIGNSSLLLDQEFYVLTLELDITYPPGGTYITETTTVTDTIDETNTINETTIVDITDTSTITVFDTLFINDTRINTETTTLPISLISSLLGVIIIAVLRKADR